MPNHEVWPALYISLAQHIALGERIRHTTPEALAALKSQRISRLWGDLQVVLVACAPAGCDAIDVPGLTYDDLCHPNNYTKTQDFARIARETVDALLIPTCTRFPEGNLILFPDCLRPESNVQIMDSQNPDLFIDWSSLSR